MASSEMVAPPPPEKCFCARCVPTDLPVVCSRCGEEVRFGYRNGIKGWLHSPTKPWTHEAIMGHILTAAALEEIRRQREEVIRYMDDGTPYTTAEFDIKRDKDPERRKLRLAILRGEDPDAPPEPLPEPEIPIHDVDVSTFPPRSGIRQMANLVSGKSKTRVPGWELLALRASRGPYLGADGSVLSISDRVTLRARGPIVLDDLLDEVYPIAVASWRDGAFDQGYVGLVNSGRVTVERVTATEFKTWIKENA